MPSSCAVCGSTSKNTGKKLSFYRFPRDRKTRDLWRTSLNIPSDFVVEDHHRVCSQHFLYGDKTDSNPTPQGDIGVRFGSPRKRPAPSRSSPRKRLKDLIKEEQVKITKKEVDWKGIVGSLDEENKKLTATVVPVVSLNFSIDGIKDNDKWVSFYTGFQSYAVFQAFYQFLLPAAENLNYYRSESAEVVKDKKDGRGRRMKMSLQDQLLLTLVRLRLALREEDLAYRFGVSVSTVSRLVTTWICFLHDYLAKLTWWPRKEVVLQHLPAAFREKYPTTICIVDASELYIETPTDLHLQSSTWSSYKHHNTAKFLIACTPNGAVSFISDLFMGSISDKELTQKSGLLQLLTGVPGSSVMADRGFLIDDDLKEIGVGLNIPPFLEGKSQFQGSN